MTDYAPGTVAKIKPYIGDADEVGLLSPSGAWVTSRGEFVNVTDIRPLVVLDPEDSPLRDWTGAGFLRDYAGELDAEARPMCADLLRAIADQIEAQTKPPRIPEPGLWGVVRESDGRELIRYSRVTKRAWADVETGNHLAWDEIDNDPTLVREGVN